MTPVDSQSPSPAFPVIAQWPHGQSGHGGRDGVSPVTKADLASVAADCQICQQQRPALSPRCATIPWGGQPVTWWQVDYIGPLSMDRTMLCPYCSRHLFWHLLSRMLLPNPPQAPNFPEHLIPPCQAPAFVRPLATHTLF